MNNAIRKWCVLMQSLIFKQTNTDILYIFIYLFIKHQTEGSFRPLT